MSHYFASHGASASEATRQAMAFIGQLVRTQAAILAYIDVFYVWAIATALMVPFVLVLARRVNLQASSVSIGH
jgi:DHA2 family multidrug resistance protein